ncbi:hypothetical protein BJ741DRAFT_672626 [Chytriomyces cf. hyalinus JEL632]|nr:hypothetical protein BJ741DRAFT_672626 [Chytriomyces cf. hyalinus JEL632]
MATFDPSQLSGYGMSHTRAQQLIQRGHVQFVCNKYDIVIVADTSPNAITKQFDWQV